MRWLTYAEWTSGAPHTVTGSVLVCPRLYSPQLDNTRQILAYLPPTYAHGSRRYPVLYMHDGQNLFDRETSSIGEWCVDETMEDLSEEGIEAIVVGIPHMGANRVHELSPYACSRSGSLGLGREYLSFVVDTVKPLIDGSFRTSTESSMTGIMGSSMGGLISLFALFQYPDVFSLCGAMSPALWFDDFRIFEDVKSGWGTSCRIYLDTGTEEVDLSIPDSPIAVEYRYRLRKVLGEETPISNAALSTLWLDDVRRLQQVIRNRGLDGSQLMYVEEEADHSEASWARRLPKALQFLLSLRATPASQISQATR